MPESIPAKSGPLSLAKWALVALGVLAAVWAGVILWWQSSQRQVTPGDVLIYLAILPAAVLAALVSFGWLRRRHRVAAAAAASAATPACPAETEQFAANAAGTDALPVLAAWSISGAGASLDEFRAALAEKRQRPQPDSGLLDDYGFPVHAARVPDLDTGAVSEFLENILANNAGLAHAYDEAGRDGFTRALALLARLLEQLAAEWPLTEQPDDGNAGIRGAATLRGSEPEIVSQEARLQLHVKLILPADFTPAEQQLALAYLLEHAGSLPVDQQSLHVQIVPASDEPAALMLAERFRAEALHAAQPQALLLLACASSVCPSVVERWQSAGTLFGSHAPHGLMPGEAAFAVLCGNRKALPLALELPACLLQGVVHGRRETSADHGGRPGHATLEAVVKEALAAGGIGADTVGAVACDADHRSSRVLECIGAMLAHTPHLDAIQDRFSVNETCGHTGAASNAGSWTAGIAQVREAGSPVLVFNVSHAFERAAAILLPPGEQPQSS